MTDRSVTTCSMSSAARPRRPRTTSWSRPSTCTSRSGGVEVLKGVSLTVKRQEVVVIIGPSGSGKTTFIRCLNHLEKIQRGSITVNGHSIGYRPGPPGAPLREDSEKNIALQRRDIGMVFQRFNLFPHKTALENITEAPIQVRGQKPDEATETSATPCWPASAWPTRPTPTRPSCRAGSSSGWRSPARWP